MEDEEEKKKIGIVERQTNLSREEIIQRLEEQKGDYLQVIKDWHGIRKKKEEQPNVSVNQEIYKQLRIRMNALQEEINKKKEEK